MSTNIQQVQQQQQARSGPSNVRSSSSETVIERRATFASFPPTNAAPQQVNNNYRRPPTPGQLLHHQMHQAENQFRTVHPGLGHCLSVKAQPQSEHKKLDRSLSEPAENQQRAQVIQNSSRYKTELCRPFEENGTCKYGDKCQFAHGMQELRNLQRHPKYKTELCRTYHTTGLCPYGPRCHFIHNSEETKKSVISTLQSVNLQAHQGVARMRSVGETGFGHILGNKLTRSVSSSAHGSRPKTMSVGSGFSLGSSSGEVSPPSSPSGSPTSLGSFFNEDPFSTFISQHHATNLGASAFSMNADFGVLLSTPTSSSHHHRQTENQSMMTSTGESRRETSKEAGLNSSESDSSKSSSSSGIGCGSPPPTHSSSYPGAPSSPVSSLGSDLEMMSLGGSSPDPCGSPMDSSPTSKQAIPRLPTFARFSSNDGPTDLRLWLSRQNIPSSLEHYPMLNFGYVYLRKQEKGLRKKLSWLEQEPMDVWLLMRRQTYSTFIRLPHLSYVACPKWVRQSIIQHLHLRDHSHFDRDKHTCYYLFESRKTGYLLIVYQKK